MKTIQLTKGYVAQVDDADFGWLSQFHWCAGVDARSLNYVIAKRAGRVGGKWTTILMHRCIMGVADSRIHIDHRDGNPLNNQRSNLRICTHAQNARNRKSSRGSTSKHLGVSYHKSSGKWWATINKGKKQINLGRFHWEHEAAAAYNEAALKYHGDFARLNVIPQTA